MGMSSYVRTLRQKIGSDLLLAPAVCGLVINDAGEILLAQRSDNGMWALVGGVMDPGENPADAVVREVLEETGVTVVPERLTGIYLTRQITYADGNRAQYVVTAFRCRPIAGVPRVADDESLAVRYFPMSALPELSFDHRRRVEHALRGGEPFFETPSGRGS